MRLLCILWILAMLSVQGCAPRQVTPVAIAQPDDGSLSCDELDKQIATNRAQALELLQKDRDVEKANAMKMAAAVALTSLIAISIDLTHEEQIMMRSLNDRNERLAYLKQQHGCPGS